MMRDRRALGVLVLMPMVFIAILGASTGQLVGMKESAAVVRIVVVDEGTDQPAAEVFERLRRFAGLHVSVAATADAAYRAVDDGDAAVAFIFGEGWQAGVDGVTLRDVLGADGAEFDLATLDVSAYARPANQVAASAARVMVTSCVYPVLLREAARRDPLAAAYVRSASVDPGAAGSPEHGDAGGAPAPINAADERVTPPGDGGGGAAATASVYQFIVPGYAVMFAFFLINIMARSFIAEREAGTLPRLRLAPLAAWQVIAGKTLPFLLVSIVQGLLLFGFGRWLFGMSWGSRPWLLLPVIVSTSLAATGLGLLTALSARTDAQVSAYGNLLVIALAGISGCFMPREWLPDVLRQISLATPHAWSLIAYDQLLVSGHPDLTRVGLHCLVLVGFAAAFLWLGCRRWAAQGGAAGLSA